MQKDSVVCISLNKIIGMQMGRFHCLYLLVSLLTIRCVHTLQAHLGHAQGEIPDTHMVE